MITNIERKSSKKTYTLVHPINKIEIQCSERYLLRWVSRGFNVVSISSTEFEDKIKTIKEG